MRRMMHAALLFATLSTSTLVFTTDAQAQQNSLLIQDAGSAQYNVPYTEDATVYSNNGVNPHSHSSSEGYYHGHTAGYPAASEPQFLKFGSCRPHSNIALLMQCDYSSRNLWAGYSQERAALVGHMMRHVDGTCDCCKTYDQACHTGANACSQGCGPGIGGNRYKFSTLHASPSSDCGSNDCGTGPLHGWRHAHRPFNYGAPVAGNCSTCATEVAAPIQYAPTPAAPQANPTPAAHAAAQQPGYNAPYRTR